MRILHILFTLFVFYTLFYLFFKTVFSLGRFLRRHSRKYKNQEEVVDGEDHGSMGADIFNHEDTIDELEDEIAKFEDIIDAEFEDIIDGEN